VREAVLSIASACEARAHALVETQSVISRKRAREITQTRSASFATKHYDLLPHEIYSRSLRVDDANVFRLVDEAYSERNKLIHTGRFGGAFGQLTELGRVRRATEWLASARLATAWMDSLSS
jgi:hypothetical protein